MRHSLKLRRKAARLTQMQVASKLGITSRMYQYIEAGQRNPSWPVALRLEQIFNTPASELLKISQRGGY
ncbi:helix-turn-helix transcriptional regulator [Desulforamulus hydrothermalis]|uniref:helix-turn-helix transcriptional regulator n=1 Tax=Desulforamulus hydrothermalis TaxID=412895 RepID=UPI0006622D90|nr:helix-turn-helix transcriptional regulator [Desulforamulus hydrothermalis]SHG73310.1 DNA-binding transcriptional regulator, XRE-family HTH domain [Desulforamulus hydrothermalis Lam5 = DSM 18033]